MANKEEHNDSEDTREHWGDNPRKGNTSDTLELLEAASAGDPDDSVFSAEGEAYINEGTDDRVSGSNRPSEVCGNHKPCGGGDESNEESCHEDLWAIGSTTGGGRVEHRGVDNLLADGISYVGVHDKSTQEFHNSGDNTSSWKGERAGSDGGSCSAMHCR